MVDVSGKVNFRENSQYYNGCFNFRENSQYYNGCLDVNGHSKLHHNNRALHQGNPQNR